MYDRELFGLLDKAGDAAFAVDAQGRICYWSENAERVLGFSRDETLSRNCADILAGHDEAGCALCSHDCHVLEMARKRGQVPSYDLHASTASGERKWLNVSVIVAELERGPSPLVVHLMRDVDRQKQMEGVTRNILVEVGQLTGREADQVLREGPSRPAPVDLTERERSILGLLSLGRSTQEITEQLYISVATVRNHIQHILSKLECHSRLDAVLSAARRRLI